MGVMIVKELNHTEWPEDLWPLLLQCREELLDPEYFDYQHGQRNTRARGCKGPMCRKAARDYGREVQRRLNDARGERISAIRKFDEFLDAYTQYAGRRYEEWKEEHGIQPRRRKIKAVRTHRKSHLIPLSTAKMLHSSRARLAS